jgi:hypothetical protein
MGDYSLVHRVDDVDFNELAHLYRVAPLGSKSPEALATVFGNSMFACFAYSGCEFPDSLSVSVIPMPVMFDMRSKNKQELIGSCPGRQELMASRGR